ncbi:MULTISPECIES: MFS transporter [unclassified Bacillus (in: firmicutes)]|uniref:MFS transporter n=1 Tax=unclassified Bacillus (in: firmicutes) TaxID=185979 RepID=UPI001BE6C523|nr:MULTISPECIES: MFS transporter [unclassified Bacillus (in: firmicutes)]MBT2723749.1 MFS transporter [Bacillus sp. ISL-46]MBT2730564.1 MFS transporter [Bacillus sp. ISL-75]
MRWVVLGFLFLLSVLNYTDKSVLGLAAEPIMTELNLSYDQFGLVGSSFFAAYAVGSIILGTLTYRFNSKYLLMMIATGWTLSLASAYFVETLTQLILLRVVLGFFEGATLGFCLVHLARWFTIAQRGVATAIMTSGTTVGTYLAAPLIVMGITNLGWQHSFAMLGVASFAWALFFFFMRDEPKQPLIEDVKSLASNKEVPFKQILKVLINPYVLSIFVVGFVSMWITTWVLTWAPTYLTKIVGLEPQRMSLIFAGMGITGTVFAICAGKFTDFLFKKNKSLIKSYDRVLVTVLLVGATSYAMTTIVSSPVLACIFLGVGLIMNTSLLPLNAAMTTIIIPKNLVGSVTGFTLSISSMAGIIGPWITGYLITLAGDDVRSGFNSGVIIIVSLYVVTAIVLLATRKLKITSTEKEDASRAAEEVQMNLDVVVEQ